MTEGRNFARLTPRPNDRLTFFQEFLRQPEQVGSVIPSSRFLEARLVRVAGIGQARLVVELGPGTGGTTRALLRALPQAGRLLAIELSPRFVERLRNSGDPRAIVHHGSAADLPAILAAHDLEAPEVILSGIPFSTMPAAVGRQILESVWSSLAPGGRFIAYQLRGHVAALGRAILGSPAVQIELRNVPPMRVYCWRKPARINGTACAAVPP